VGEEKRGRRRGVGSSDHACIFITRCGALRGEKGKTRRFAQLRSACEEEEGRQERKILVPFLPAGLEGEGDSSISLSWAPIKKKEGERNI